MRRPFSLLNICALVVLGICVGVGARAESTATPSETYASLMQLGRMALKSDAPKKATVYFAEARRLAPSELHAQLSLTEAFARSGKVRKAEVFLLYLLEQPEYVKFEPRYLAALTKLQTSYPFVTSAFFAALPSSNIRNTSSETFFDTLIGRFQIDNGGRETSGIGFEAGLHGTYRHPLAEDLSFEAGTTIKRIWYEDDDLRYWHGRLTTDIKKVGAFGSIRGGLHYDHTYYAQDQEDRADRNASGIHGQWSQSLTTHTRLTLNGVAEHRDYPNKDTLSGPYASMSIALAKTFVGGATAQFGGAIERSKPSLDHHRYWGAKLQAGYQTDITEALRAGVNLSAKLRIYDTEFASVDYARRDDIYRFGFSLSDSRIKVFGGTPKLSCSYKVKNSNVSLYKSASTDCRIGWSYKF